MTVADNISVAGNIYVTTFATLHLLYSILTYLCFQIYNSCNWFKLGTMLNYFLEIYHSLTRDLLLPVWNASSSNTELEHVHVSSAWFFQHPTHNPNVTSRPPCCTVAQLFEQKASTWNSMLKAHVMMAAKLKTLGWRSSGSMAAIFVYWREL
jgi:hypothetical protein